MKTGRRTEELREDNEDMQPTPCQPSQLCAICKNRGYYDGIKCICPEMFHGTFCESSTVPVDCKNGGYYDGVMCVCPEMFYGPLCENTVDRLPPVKGVNTTVTVELRITNHVYTENLTDTTSNKYKEFKSLFKTQMNSVYSSIPGYKDVSITRIAQGSIIVDHEVIVELEYKMDVVVETQYKEILQAITKKVEEAKEGDCSVHDPDCLEFDKVYGDVLENDIPQIEACHDIVSGFKEFYFHTITSNGLSCISFCDPLYEKYKSCNGGRCVIQENIGPKCLCPRTDIYLYTGSHCSGRILKDALFGGLGAVFGVLLIVIITVSILLASKNKKKSGDNLFSNHRDSMKRNDQQTAQHGIANVTFREEPDPYYSVPENYLHSKDNPYLRPQTQPVRFSNNNQIRFSNNNQIRY